MDGTSAAKHRQEHQADPLYPVITYVIFMTGLLLEASKAPCLIALLEHALSRRVSLFHYYGGTGGHFPGYMRCAVCADIAMLAPEIEEACR
jgi:hypothetical protein